MRHRIAGKKLGKNTAHRRAMTRNFIRSMIEHERLVTTLPKAKGLRPAIERMITLGKSKNLQNIRKAMGELQDREIVKKLFDEIGPRFATRQGGYTRIVRLSGYRIGDGGSKAIIELVDNKVLERKLAQASAD